MTIVEGKDVALVARRMDPELLALGACVSRMVRTVPQSVFWCRRSPSPSTRVAVVGLVAMVEMARAMVGDENGAMSVRSDHMDFR